MEINIWTLILDNFHQWNFFKQFYKSSFSNRYFNEQSAHRLPNPRSNPLPLLQNETKQKHKKKKRRKKKKEGIKIIHRLIKTEIQEENTNWSDEIKKKPRCITDWPPSDATRMKQFAFFFPLKPPSTSPSLLPSVLPSVFLLLYRASNKIERDSVTPARSQPRLFLHFLEH